MKKLRWLIARQGLVAMALWTACGVSSSATLRVASAFDPQTMDPHALALLYWESYRL